MRSLIQTAIGLVIVAIGLAACRSGPSSDSVPADTRPDRSTEVPEQRAAALETLPGSRKFRVVAEKSLLQIQAFRGGSLARLGHNHIIASRHLRGWVGLADDLEKTRMELTIPVELLTIDEPELRKAAGPDFASEVPDSAREGTRNNMLGEALLDGDRFPGIELRCKAIEMQDTELVATILVTVKSATSEHRVPIRVQRDGDQVTANGQLTLTQSALGLTPFTVMLGALAVQDELHVNFAIVALAANSPS